jgi:hypothetical protein
MKTSLRLMLTALLVCGITYAAAGAPLPAKPAAQFAALGSSPH